MACPDWKECFHEECNKVRNCYNVSFWATYWKNKGKQTKTEKYVPKVRQRGKKYYTEKGFRKHRLIRTKKCEIRQKGCHLPKICGVLAECVLYHSRTLARPELIPKLKEIETTGAAIRILEEIMPSLKRWNSRINFKSESE